MTDSEQQAHYVDVYVGNRIRARRNQLGFSVPYVAEKVGKSVQQINKYEQAFNRVSASMLYLLAEALECPIEYFFEGVEGLGYSMDAMPQIDQDVLRVASDFARLSQPQRSAVEHVIAAMLHNT